MATNRVTIDEIVASSDLGTPQEISGMARLGYWIFLWLLGLVLVEVALLVLYGLKTYPRLEEVRELVTADSSIEPLQAWREMRDEWVVQFKDLGQVFLVNPIVPLLGAVLGYIFGSRQVSGDD
ncbi:MAG: hypothetical protein M3285_12625 [Actinomycetota bacterium]|nr:hypothetical protein [Actinomycetota bacterium]MDQ3956381.1 hypothetical protein [Actinomycetota bacterium]